MPEISAGRKPFKCERFLLFFFLLKSVISFQVFPYFLKSFITHGRDMLRRI